MIISKEKESHFKYNPRLDNANRDILFKDKVEKAKHFLIEKGMLIEVVQKNGTLFCIKNAENGSKENQENAHTLRA
jgi:hypothetical protein